jgi:hypothetical protein
MRQHFVNVRFCRREISVDVSIVDASILSKPKFCQREYFVDANILSTQIFCRHQHFVDESILLTPAISQCQYFVGAYSAQTRTGIGYLRNPQQLN